MQKFGIDTALEKPSSLGRTGTKLRQAIKSYSDEQKNGFSKKPEKEFLQIIGNYLYKLMVQKELGGFIDANMYWIAKIYEIAEGAHRYAGVNLSAQQNDTD